MESKGGSVTLHILYWAFIVLFTHLLAQTYARILSTSDVRNLMLRRNELSILKSMPRRLFSRFPFSDVINE